MLIYCITYFHCFYWLLHICLFFFVIDLPLSLSFSWYSLCCCFDCLEGVVSHWCSQIKVAVHIWSTDQMPSLKMKTKLSMGCFKEKNGLHVCQKSSIISKKSCSYVRISEHTAEFDTCIHECQDGKQLL